MGRKKLATGKTTPDQDWFKGKCPFFLNTCGNPLKGADLSVLSRVIGVENVLAGDIRRLHTTKLANHKDASIRENEGFIAGHDSRTFREYYQQDSSRIAQVCVTALHDGQETTKPLEHIPERPSIEVQRVADKAEAAANLVKTKKVGALNYNNPVDLKSAKLFLKSGLTQDQDLIKLTKLKKKAKEWVILASKLCCRKNTEAGLMRGALVQMVIGTRGGVSRYSFRFPPYQLLYIL